MNELFKASIRKMTLQGVKAAGMRGARAALNKYTQKISEMNRKRLAGGKYTSGQTIQEGYSKGWGRKRKKKGLQVDFVDLKYTEKFHKSIASDVDDGFVGISTDDDKYKWIEKMFNQKRAEDNNLLGLSEEDIQEVLLKTSPMVAQEIVKYFGV